MSEGVQQEAITEDQLSDETRALAEKGREGFTAPNPAPVSSGPQRPDHVPEQFWDPVKGEVRSDALLKSYGELRKTFDSRKPAEEKPNEGEPKPDDLKIGDQKTPDEPKPDAAAEPAKVTEAITAARQAYATSGEIGEDQRKALNAVGFDDDTIDTYLAGVKALETGIAKSVFDVAGGEDSYRAAVAWAAENWSAEEIKAYDQALGTEAGRKLAVQGLMAAYGNVAPAEGSRVFAENGSANAGDVYRSAAEFTIDLRKADDANDPAARRAALAKLERSKAAGTIQRVGDRRMVKLQPGRR